MKQHDSHLRLTWKFHLGLHIPVKPNRAAGIVRHVLLGACLVTLAFGLLPLVSLLLAGS